jgi:hypothetical protein
MNAIQQHSISTSHSTAKAALKQRGLHPGPRPIIRLRSIIALSALLAALLVTPIMFAENKVMGEVQLEGKSNVEKTSGVWVDGEYVGYLKELKGSKKVMLLPGNHTISVRQDGFQDFNATIDLEPGEKHIVFVAMAKAVTGVPPAQTALVKIEVNPSRAAVFLDGSFVGHVGEFEGVGKGMLVGPGAHEINIALAGYQTFKTNINPIANQKVEIKTDLVKNDAPLTEPIANGESAPTPPQPGAGDAPPAPQR